MLVQTIGALVIASFGLSSWVYAAEIIEYAGCKEEDFITIEENEVVVDFQGSSYEPACIIVKAGTKVTLPAMKKHPLQAAQDFENIINPFRSENGEFSEDQTRELTEVGYYGYYCTQHADPADGSGMGGMIRVIAPQ